LLYWPNLWKRRQTNLLCNLRSNHFARSTPGGITIENSESLCICNLLLVLILTFRYYQKLVSNFEDSSNKQKKQKGKTLS
jgi:hypothetical protein